MTLSISAQPVPLLKDKTGIVRVVGSRVTLDTVIVSFEQGLAPEEIVMHYPTLNLADIYSIVAYYLHNRTEVDSYLAEQKAQAAEIRQKIEANSNIAEIRERLLARWKQQQSGNA